MLESDVNWAVKFLASRREFSHSFDQYLKQVCLPYSLMHCRLLKVQPTEENCHIERENEHVSLIARKGALLILFLADSVWSCDRDDGLSAHEGNALLDADHRGRPRGAANGRRTGRRPSQNGRPECGGQRGHSRVARQIHRRQGAVHSGLLQHSAREDQGLCGMKKRFDELIDELQDTGTAVRKRVIRIIREICEKYPNYEKVCLRPCCSAD